MHILHVIPFFTPRMGGAAQVCYQLARRQGERGHQVNVLTSNYGIHEAQFSRGYFQVTCLPNLIARWGFYLTPALASWAKTNLKNFDVIHMHTFRTFQNAIVSRFALRYQIPFILSAHGTLPILGERKLPKKAYDLVAGKRVLRSATRVVAVSEIEEEQYRQMGVDASRIQVIPNGLDLAEFEHLPERGTFRSRYSLPEAETKLILFLGRLHKLKGVDFLLEAFARLDQNYGPSVLIIAGPDEGEQAMAERLARRLQVRDRVLFVGPLYGIDKLAAYRDADVLVSPASYEIFGLVPCEALLCGTPAIVGAVSGMAQLLGRIGAVYLIEYGDVEELAGALKRALTQREEAEMMVCRGQAYIHEHLNWDTIAGKMEELYIKVKREAGQAL